MIYSVVWIWRGVRIFVFGGEGGIMIVIEWIYIWFCFCREENE